VARREYAAAVGTAKTMLALGRHLGEHPTLAGNRIGIEAADMAVTTLEELAQQPGSPNLYWALAGLPTPVVELRKGAQGACTLAQTELKSLRDDRAMTGAEVSEFVAGLSGRLGFARAEAGRPPVNVRAAIQALVEDKPRVGAARNRLLASAPTASLNDKWSAVMILGFTPTQVVLLDERHRFEAERDERMKLLTLPPYQIDAFAARAVPAREEGLFDGFLPNVVEARMTQARLQRRIVLLQHAEALRLYAADHGGALPKSLDEIGVPLPVDPFTGQPFRYEVADATATLRDSPPRGGEPNPAYAVRYG
jgi:hypothetical protein